MIAPFCLLFLQTGAPVEVAKQEEVFDTLELRVTSVRPRQALVDRGRVDGLFLKDRVTFRLKDGRIAGGTVVEVSDRDGVVQLDDPAISPVAGTKGEARIPRSRRPAPVVPPPAPPQEPAPAPETAPGDQAVTDPGEAPEHPPWERQDDWQPGEPLLAQVRPLRPSERAPRIGGRVYSILDFTSSTEGNRSDLFARTGTSLLFENAFKAGGDLNLDFELNYRNTEVPDNDDEERADIRLDRLSYEWGGNRFSADRYEVGRFLHHDVPEFGVLDGGQWTHRLPGGDTFGATLGFLPDPDVDMRTGDDLQVAGYYRWVNDETEQISLTGGYQKTWHHLDTDRDLLLAKLVYLPIEGWDVTGTTWLDVYTDGDESKGSGLGLTQAYLSSGKTWEGGSSLRFTYSHQEFPENELDEFTPVTLNQLADDHSDRVAATTRQRLGRNFGVFATGGVWMDQDDEGGDGEFGMEFDEIAFSGSHAELAGFYSGGRFSDTVGGRASLGSSTSMGDWRLGYEFSYDDVKGFDADNNSLPNHRIGASWETHSASRWSFSLHAELLLFDEETSVLAGFFLQRSF